MKTCIITGASRGIGREIAIKLSMHDDIKNFILVARNEEGLKETKSLMNQEKNIQIYSMDLTNLKTIQNIIENIGEKYGNIDILINNAGYANPKSLLETSVENWEKTFKVNVTSMFIFVRECVRYMKNKGGKIVNVASTAGISSRPGWIAYSSSKAAVVSMSNTLSDELREYGIKVYCISPGRCATELRRILAPDEDPTTIMQPQHVAQIVSNLISDLGNCLDGQNIVIRHK